MECIKYSLVYTADSIRKFDSKSNRRADSIPDSIRTQKKTIRRSLMHREALRSFQIEVWGHEKRIVLASDRRFDSKQLNN